MKTFVLLIILGLSLSTNAQKFSKRDLKMLNRLKFEKNQIETPNQKLQKELANVLFLQKKYKTNRTFSDIFTTVGVSSVILGTLLIFQNGKNKGAGIAQSLGLYCIAVGALNIGVSIPFRAGAKKRKRERDALIKKLQN